MLSFAHIRSFASLALQLAILGVLIGAFFVPMPQVSGVSMEPRLIPGERVIINTLAYRFGAPSRGDIVAFHHDAPTPELFIKRVIAVAGDRVRVERGTVSVNGQALVEPYVRFTDQRSFAEVTVPAASVYVLGDNRANSEDSRFFGTVPDSALVGKALAGIWPPAAAGAL